MPGHLVSPSDLQAGQDPGHRVRTPWSAGVVVCDGPDPPLELLVSPGDIGRTLYHQLPSGRGCRFGIKKVVVRHLVVEWMMGRWWGGRETRRPFLDILEVKFCRVFRILV